MDWKTELLTELLSCGYADLDILKDCKYDMEDVIEYVKDMGYEKIDINNLAYAMFQLGINNIQEWINNRKSELEESEELSEEEQEELDSLKELEPNEDIQSFHNYLDTHVYISDSSGKEEVYRKYCQAALDEFEEKTGFSI